MIIIIIIIILIFTFALLKTTRPPRSLFFFSYSYTKFVCNFQFEKFFNNNNNNNSNNNKRHLIYSANFHMNAQLRFTKFLKIIIIKRSFSYISTYK